ncbi:DciA family protein [Kitasatospora cathayae]|uniref:DciA family protein n=1 Tax=Kitasatospora cathayae TaxID=3004092 RepID=A0ABY7QJD2_9ACTN|nr:DciA family protein [Kitasatospora sp. HUAS 3-15]WBP91971.1 DciA family protein [Kitasatospora sp. HUAS 3-15]
MTQPTGSGADLARTALRAARQAARTNGNAPTQRAARTVRTAVPRAQGPREPQPIADVFLALVAAHGWTLGTAGGGLRDRWPSIVGADAAAHWHLAGYDPTTRRLRVVADSPAWAVQLRLHLRRILTDLEQLRPGTVVAIDVRVGPAPVVQHDQGPDDRPARRDDRPAAQPARPPLADHAAYQDLRRRMREDAVARQAALDEAAAEREAILRQHYNWLREPEDAHRPAIEDTPVTDPNEHARQQRERHRAALAVARATRAGAILLRPVRLAPSQAGAA